MKRAVRNGTIIAESADNVIVEGNHYFARRASEHEYFAASDLVSRCPWKGDAASFDVTVDYEVNTGAARFYDDPKPAAAEIAGQVAFRRGATIES